MTRKPDSEPNATLDPGRQACAARKPDSEPSATLDPGRQACAARKPDSEPKATLEPERRARAARKPGLAPDATLEPDAEARVERGSEPTGFDLDARWRLHPSVALRHERFGALAYHFGNRRLSFLKSPVLVSIVTGLDGARSAREACALAGVGDGELSSYRRALARLAESGMIEAGA